MARLSLENLKEEDIRSLLDIKEIHSHEFHEWCKKYGGDAFDNDISEFDFMMKAVRFLVDKGYNIFQI